MFKHVHFVCMRIQCLHRELVYMHAGLHVYVHVYIPDDQPTTHPHTHTHLLPQWVNPERACQSELLLICAVPDIPHLIVKMPAERERERERERECV